MLLSPGEPVRNRKKKSENSILARLFPRLPFIFIASNMQLTLCFLMCREEEVSQHPRKKAREDPERNPTPGTGEGADSSFGASNVTAGDTSQAGAPRTIAEDHQEEEHQEPSPSRTSLARTSPPRNSPARDSLGRDSPARASLGRSTNEALPDADAAVTVIIEGEGEPVQTTIPGAFPQLFSLLLVNLTH